MNNLLLRKKEERRGKKKRGQSPKGPVAKRTVKVYDQIPDSRADGLYHYSWKDGLFRGRLIAVIKLNGEINWEFREPIPENLKKMKKMEDERHDFSTLFKGRKYTIKVKDIPKKKVLVKERIDSNPVERMVNKVFHQYSIVNYDPLSSSPAVAHDSVCVGSESGNLYTINKIDGKLRWKFETNSIILSSPVIVDGTIIFCDTNKFLYALDLVTGKKIWIRDIGKGSVSSACIENNVLYFTTSMKEKTGPVRAKVQILGRLSENEGLRLNFTPPILQS